MLNKLLKFFQMFIKFKFKKSTTFLKLKTILYIGGKFNIYLPKKRKFGNNLSNRGIKRKKVKKDIKKDLY